MRRSSPRLIGAIVGLLLVAGLVAALTIGSQPATCARCHQEPATAMQTTAHASTTCYACHVDGAWDMPRQKLSEILVMYPKAVFGGKPEGPVRQTARSACLVCHSTINNAVATGTYVRVNHLSCAQGASCDGCHASTAHGAAVRWATGPAMEDCVRCHDSKGISADCETCHLEKTTAKLESRGPWQVTHGPNWERTHGMGDLTTCEICHAPSTYNTTGFCAECHGIDVPHPVDFGGTHGELAIADSDSCYTCHEASLCEGCHQIEMPHPAGFTRQHSDIAGGYTDPDCIRCHVTTDCDQCHANHTHPGGSTGVPVPWPLTNEDRRPEAQ